MREEVRASALVVGSRNTGNGEDDRAESDRIGERRPRMADKGAVRQRSGVILQRKKNRLGQFLRQHLHVWRRTTSVRRL